MNLPYSNLKIEHWNPGATAPLVLPIQVICNTSDEQIYTNIHTNSRNGREWIAQVPAHERVAILCGSGPSLADTLSEIEAERSFSNADLFALNGAAWFLDDKGLNPDFQVILDARAETLPLVGPAKQHLFASQVDPSLFAIAPRAKLWQLQVEGIDHILPEYPHDYCLVGGAASVGNTAICLVYAMGYRTMRLYGYDSCHREGKGHAFPQALNNGDPLAQVTFMGKDYLTSLTMKLQAEKFQQTARELKKLGVHIHVCGSGLLPDMWRAPREALTEYEKYQRMWQLPEYRDYSPGEELVGTFLEKAWPRKDETIVDFGCGTGRAGWKLHRMGYNVTLTDFVENSRDLEARNLPFRQADLSQPDLQLSEHPADVGYCTDVMEHIPPAQVEQVVRNVMHNAGRVFFQISTVDDACGALINQELHLTVQPHKWWLALFEGMGYKILWNEERPTTALFLVQ